MSANLDVSRGRTILSESCALSPAAVLMALCLASGPLTARASGQIHGEPDPAPLASPVECVEPPWRFRPPVDALGPGGVPLISQPASGAVDRSILPYPGVVTDDRIVCRFFVLRRTDGSGGLDEALIPKMMRDLNYGFRNVPFYFVREPGTSYIDDDGTYADIPNYAAQIALVNSGYADGVLSWYIAPHITNGATGTGTQVAGAWVGPPYTTGMRGVLMAYPNMGTPANIVTPTHEVGHLGLLHHPFETAFGVQCTSEVNCHLRGDRVCDTPASPGLGPSLVLGTGEYIGTLLGPCLNDPPFAPNPLLYMDSSGLAGHVYRDEFSPGQIDRFKQWFIHQQGDLVGPARPHFIVDCDNDGLDDAEQVLLGLATDLDRDLVPDACQTYPKAGDLMVCGMTNNSQNRPRYFDGTTGAYAGEIWNGMTWAHSLRLGPDGLVYMPSLSHLVRLNLATGRTHDNFLDGAPENAGTFVDLLFESDGNILLLDNLSNNIRRYDGATGSYMGVFSGLGAMTRPKYMEYGNDGNIYVVGTAVQGNSVRRISAVDGSPMGAFVTAGSGGLTAGQGLTFHGSYLYVSEGATSRVLRYDGFTGAFVDAFVSAGSGGLSNPHSLRFGPDGHLYVASRGSNSVKRYDGTSGAYLGDFLAAGAGGDPGSGGLDNPAGLLFLP